METFRRVTPLVEVVSLDEAFLDVRGSTRRLGDPVEIAERLRATIHDEQGITCSVGVAASVSVAKLASRRAKPDGVVVVPPEEITSFLHPLDVGELYGVGEKTQAMLHRLGLVTVGDVAHTPLRTLQRAVGDGPRQPAARAGLGHRPARDHPGPGRACSGMGGDPDKSMGAQETFGRDIDDREVMLREVLKLTAKVAAPDAGRRGGRPHRLDHGPVRRLHHDHPVPHDARGHRRDPGDLPHRRRVSTTPSGCSGPGCAWSGCGSRGWLPRTTVHRQLVLGEREHGWSDADRAVDRATLRFGAAVVQPASLLRR